MVSLSGVSHILCGGNQRVESLFTSRWKSSLMTIEAPVLLSEEQGIFVVVVAVAVLVWGGVLVPGKYLPRIWKQAFLKLL